MIAIILYVYSIASLIASLALALALLADCLSAILFVDVLNLKELARASNIQADRLNESVFGYDFDIFAAGLGMRFIERFAHTKLCCAADALYDYSLLYLAVLCRNDTNGIFQWEQMGRVN